MNNPRDKDPIIRHLYGAVSKDVFKDNQIGIVVCPHCLKKVVVLESK